MTEEQLAEIRRRVEASTPGPWTWIGLAAAILAVLWVLDAVAWMVPSARAILIPLLVAGMVAVTLCALIAIVLFERQRRKARS